MDFTLSDRSRELQERLAAFMDECVYLAEAVYARGRATSLDPHHVPPVVEDLEVEVTRTVNPCYPAWREQVWQYAPLSLVTGTLACSSQKHAPARGSARGKNISRCIFGTGEQKRRWLDPLLEGEILLVLRDDRA